MANKTAHSPCEQRQDIESSANQEEYGACYVRALVVHAEKNAARDERYDRSDPLIDVEKAKRDQGDRVHNDGNNGAHPCLRKKRHNQRVEVIG